MERSSIRLILLTFCLLPLATGETRLFGAGDRHDGDRAAISEALAAQRTSWNQGDIDAFMEVYWHSQEVAESRVVGMGCVRGTRKTTPIANRWGTSNLPILNSGSLDKMRHWF